MRRGAAVAAALATVVAAATIVATGCRSAPPLRYYTLSSGEPPATAGDSPLVGIRHLRVDPPFDQDRLVRLGVGEEVRFHDAHRWAAPLGRLLPLALAEGLSAYSAIGHLEPAASGRRYDAYLDGRLLQLAEVVTSAGRSARVRLELELSSPDSAVRWRGVVGAEVPLLGDEVGDAVNGLRRALEAGIADVAPAIAAALGQVTVGGGA